MKIQSVLTGDSKRLAEMTNPSSKEESNKKFKEGRDYVGLGRKIFFVDHVPQGAPMWYDRRRIAAYVCEDIRKFGCIGETLCDENIKDNTEGSPSDPVETARRTLRNEMMIQSELYGDIERVTEMITPLAA